MGRDPGSDLNRLPTCALPAPYPRPPVRAIPVFKPILPQGRGFRAPPAPLNGPQSLYSSQIRPEGGKVPFGRG